MEYPYNGMPGSCEKHSVERSSGYSVKGKKKNHSSVICKCLYKNRGNIYTLPLFVFV